MNWLSSTLLVLIALYFTFSQARSAKKPRIRIEILDDLLFAPGEQVKLTITLLNRPYFYARPTATEIRAYINVEATVQPLRLVFGTALSNVDKQVKERTQQFIRVHNETLSVVAMCVCNPDCAAVWVQS